MPKSSFRVTLVGDPEDGGKVRLNEFLDFLKNLRSCLYRVDSFLTRTEKPSTYYRISDLSSGSATVEIEAVSRPEAQNAAKAVVDTFFDGLRQLEEKAQAPARFDRPLLEAFKELAKPLHGRTKGIEVGRGHLRTRITKRLEQNVDEIIGEDLISAGSISGHLDLVNVHDKNAFFVYPVLGPTKVECLFDEELLEKIKTGLKRHVVVFGSLHYKQNEVFPYRVDVQDIEVFPHQDELPDLRSLRGAVPGITGELDSVTFVRRLRDAE